MKQRDVRGLNPGPPDPEVEVLTTRPERIKGVKGNETVVLRQ